MLLHLLFSVCSFFPVAVIIVDIYCLFTILHTFLAITGHVEEEKDEEKSM